MGGSLVVFQVDSDSDGVPDTWQGLFGSVLPAELGAGGSCSAGAYSYMYSIDKYVIHM